MQPTAMINIILESVLARLQCITFHTRPAKSMFLSVLCRIYVTNVSNLLSLAHVSSDEMKMDKRCAHLFNGNDPVIVWRMEQMKC